MSLYDDWKAIAEEERGQREHKAFWDGYFEAEKKNYIRILSEYGTPAEGKLSELAESFEMDEVTFLGFLDGINSSLKKELKLESLKSGSKLSLDVDFDKLYFNMLDCKATWLYTLKEWDGVLSEERRHEITREFRASKMFVKTRTPGPNDPCPCGSGKKYKKCCGNK